jgi:ribosomal protein S18 acetylase RimI-like enzyme
VDTTVPASAGDLTVRRSYLPDDAEAIIELHRRVYPPEYGVDESFVDDIAITLSGLEANGFPGPGEGAWLVDGAGGLAGSLILSDEGAGEGRVRLFVFDQAARGRGLGRRLLRELLTLAGDSGYERLTLATFADLRAAAHLYREAGFVVVREDGAPRWGRADFNYQHYELRL